MRTFAGAVRTFRNDHILAAHVARVAVEAMDVLSLRRLQDQLMDADGLPAVLATYESASLRIVGEPSRRNAERFHMRQVFGGQDRFAITVGQWDRRHHSALCIDEEPHGSCLLSLGHWFLWAIAARPARHVPAGGAFVMWVGWVWLSLCDTAVCRSG